MFDHYMQEAAEERARDLLLGAGKAHPTKHSDVSSSGHGAISDDITSIGAVPRSFFASLPSEGFCRQETEIVARLCGWIMQFDTCSLRWAGEALETQKVSKGFLPRGIPLSLWLKERVEDMGIVEVFEKHGEEWLGAGPCFDPSSAVGDPSTYVSLSDSEAEV